MSKKDITYKWGEDHLIIELGNRAEPRIQVLFWAEFLFTAGMATIFLVQSLPFTLNIWHSIAAIGAATLYMLASYRFITRMFSEEKVLLNKHDLVLIKTIPFATHKRHFDWKGIGPLHYTGKAEKTAHPLKGNNFDYFGFDTHEHLIQRLHHEGNLCFYYGGYPIYFARNVYSWDAEEMVYMMQLFAGNKLRLSAEFKSILLQAEDSN